MSWRLVRSVSAVVVIASLAIAAYFLFQPYSSQSHAQDRDLEIRLDFNPFRPRREFRDSLSMTLRGDGKARVIHHRRGMFIDAVYEGTLPEAETMRLVARAKQAQSEWVIPKVQPGGHSPLFRMLVLPAGSSDEKDVFGGPLDSASESTRSLVEDLLVVWNRLNKVPPAEAYLRSMPLLAEELKRVQQNKQVRVLPASELPSNLQQPITESLNHPRDFVPILRTQHDQLINYKQFVVSAKGFSYTLSLSLPTPAESTNPSP